MRKTVILLTSIVLLYLVPSIAIKAVYGPSFGFMEGEDCWVPDSGGGWVKHGEPISGPPTIPSEQVPYMLQYLPIFLPGLLLMLFLFTPLGKHLEDPVEPDSSSQADSTSDQ